MYCHVLCVQVRAQPGVASKPSRDFLARQRVASSAENAMRPALMRPAPMCPRFNSLHQFSSYYSVREV